MDTIELSIKFYNLENVTSQTIYYRAFKSDMTGYIVDSSVPRSTAAYDMTSSECGEKSTTVPLRKLYTYPTPNANHQRNKYSKLSSSARAQEVVYRNKWRTSDHRVSYRAKASAKERKWYTSESQEGGTR